GGFGIYRWSRRTLGEIGQIGSIRRPLIVQNAFLPNEGITVLAFGINGFQRLGFGFGVVVEKQQSAVGKSREKARGKKRLKAWLQRNFDKRMELTAVGLDAPNLPAGRCSGSCVDRNKKNLIF